MHVWVLFFIYYQYTCVVGYELKQEKNGHFGRWERKYTINNISFLCFGIFRLVFLLFFFLYTECFNKIILINITLNCYFTNQTIASCFARSLSLSLSLSLSNFFFTLLKNKRINILDNLNKHI